MFDEHFPLLVQHLANFVEICDLEKYYAERDKEAVFKTTEEWGMKVMKEKFMPLVVEEITKLLPEWEELTNQSNGWVACHSIIVVWLSINDPLFTTLTPRDQNILKWSTLIHDIRKRQDPTYLGKDHIHPFRSGSSVLDIFCRMGLIKDCEEIETTKGLIDESVQPLSIDKEDYGKKLCT